MNGTRSSSNGAVEDMKLVVDTGGTFTDLVAVDTSGAVRMHKAPTTPEDPVVGVLDVLRLAAERAGVPSERYLGRASMLIHGTTRAVNAILTGTTARTALLTTKGHRDVLLLREGGRTDPFDWSQPYPQPYIPRSRTFGIRERIDAQGKVIERLDEEDVRGAIDALRAAEVEAVAVCLLWSIVNPAHELRIAEMLDEQLPGVPHTLSHQLNPVIREYRRASAAAMDASLKPLMGSYLSTLQDRLVAAGFRGRLLMATSHGGVLDAADVGAAPIHSVNSGPALAPVAGRHYAKVDASPLDAIVADTGGTSYDVSLVQGDLIPTTKETWLGGRFTGDMTGFPSVDVKSIGAGGGSIAWLDEGGLLHVGPESAGATPGPACYGRGGTRPTLTDACVVLGHLDPDYFLQGAIRLDSDLATGAVRREIAAPLGVSVEEAATAILALATEHMVQAITEITVNRGVDPRSAALVGGGGAAGLNSIAIARRLGCPVVVIPSLAAALSSAGGALSDLVAERSATLISQASGFDYDRANEVLAQLEAACGEFRDRVGADSANSSMRFWFEGRYAHQVWELEVPMRHSRIDGQGVLAEMVQDFHSMHRQVYGVDDPRSDIEILTLRARIVCGLGSRLNDLGDAPERPPEARRRRAFFREAGWCDTDVWRADELPSGMEVAGPALVEFPFTTVVVDPGAKAEMTPNRNLVAWPSGGRVARSEAEVI